MSAPIVRMTLVMLVIVAAFVGGLYVGQRRSLDVALSMMAADTTGNLAQRVETLARIKTGDHAGAVAFLEASRRRCSPALRKVLENGARQQ